MFSSFFAWSLDLSWSKEHVQHTDCLSNMQVSGIFPHTHRHTLAYTSLMVYSGRVGGADDSRLSVYLIEMFLETYKLQTHA